MKKSENDKIEIQELYEKSENIKYANARSQYESRLSHILERRKELQDDELRRIDSLLRDLFNTNLKNRKLKPYKTNFLLKRET